MSTLVSRLPDGILFAAVLLAIALAYAALLHLLTLPVKKPRRRPAARLLIGIVCLACFLAGIASYFQTKP
jgi:hypothetical protein